MSDQLATTICPCCGNWKTYSAPKCHKCYQDDLKNVIGVLKGIRHSLYSALLHKRIHKGVYGSIDTIIYNVLAKIEDVKS